jgi:hypothetical protein
MRTTVRLPDELMRAAKRRAQETGRSLTQLLERSLMPAIVSHALTDVVIEPWLILAALGGSVGRS